MKTVGEWSRAFDLLWDNVMSGKAPGLAEYEKSIVLTESENALMKDYLSAGSNVWKEGYDDSARRQSDFRTLIVSKKLYSVSNLDTTLGFNTREGTRSFICPKDVLLIMNEEVSSGNSRYQVLPISSEEYTRLMLSPYKYPPKDTVWRIISHLGTDGEISYPTIELIGRFRSSDTIDYRMRYFRRPKPIILEDLLGDLSIEGETRAMTCELPEHLHDEILQRAVQIAKITWVDMKSQPTQQTA